MRALGTPVLLFGDLILESERERDTVMCHITDLEYMIMVCVWLCFADQRAAGACSARREEEPCSRRHGSGHRRLLSVEAAGSRRRHHTCSAV
jgi:hypothetical protein